MIQVVTNARSQQDADILSSEFFRQFTQVSEAVHHLTDAEAMPKVVKRIVPVVFLH